MSDWGPRDLAVACMLAAGAWGWWKVYSEWERTGTTDFPFREWTLVCVGWAVTYAVLSAWRAIWGE